jgi:hypothetical protein
VQTCESESGQIPIGVVENPIYFAEACGTETPLDSFDVMCLPLISAIDEIFYIWSDGNGTTGVKDDNKIV